MKHPEITPEFIEEQKENLLKEREVVESELKTVGVQNPQNPKDWIATASDMSIDSADQNELSDKFEEYGENQSLVSNLEVRLANIQRALLKIEDGTYGISEITGNPIELDRLVANPAARAEKAHMDEEATLPL